MKELTVASERSLQLGSAIFAELAQWKRQAQAEGKTIIDLGIGSPDLPPSERVIRALKEAVSDAGNYGYPGSAGLLEFREVAAEWCRHRFDIELDPESEVLTLIGSQDGLAHLALSICNPGDVAIVPDPGYPVYEAGLALAGVTPYRVPLREENGYLPDLEQIPVDIRQKAKFMLLNYPSNPLTVPADLSFFERWIDFARKYDIVAVHDLAYSELAFDGLKPPSILQIPGAKQVAVEFHSLSKSFNMAGCRIGFAIGRRDVLQALATVKSNIDYGVFLPIQRAGIEALKENMEQGGENRYARIYERRRDVFVDQLQQYGWQVEKPKATMFVWAKVPPGWASRQISREMLFHAGVVVVPGDAFGREGEGYVRIALVQDESVLIEAARRLGMTIQNLQKNDVG